MLVAELLCFEIFQTEYIPIYYCIGFGNGKGLRIFFKAESDITSMYLLTPVAPNLLLYPLRLPINHRKNCTTAWRILKSFLKASVGDISFFSFQRLTAVEPPKYYISKVYCLLFTYLGTYPPGPLMLSILPNTQLEYYQVEY